MPAGSTYEPIATTTLGSAAADITFSSIPSTYTDLVIISSIKISTNPGEDPRLQFNSDTSSNYSRTDILGDGSTASSGRLSNRSHLDFGGLSTSDFCPLIISVNNYANTNVYKTALGRFNRPDGTVGATVGLWRSTSAITSLRFFLGSTFTYTAGSTFTLYGITAA